MMDVDKEASVEPIAVVQDDLDTAATLPELPLDVLMLVSDQLDAKQVCQGLAQTNQKFSLIFGDYSYWEQRLRASSKDYLHFLQDANQISSGGELRRKVYYWEKVNKNFAVNRPRETFLGEEGHEQILGNFRCMEFGANGDFLAVTLNDRNCVMVWNMAIAMERLGPVEPVVYHDHDQIVTSLTTTDYQISTGAYDGTIRLRDLDRLEGPEGFILCSAGLVQCHVRRNDLIFCGTRGGTFEVFDIRAGDEPQIREKIFDSSEICHDFKIQQRCHDSILAGWDNGIRKLKLFDLRSRQIANENEIATWSLTMDLGDGQLWIGGDKGKVWQYDPDALERVANHTVSLGHTANNGWLPDAQFMEYVRSVKYAHGHLFSADIRQVKLHEIGKIPKLIWEEEIVFSQMAFHEERSLLAVGVGYTPDQIKLMYPRMLASWMW